MTTTATSALQLKGVMPGITVNDLQASIRFFEGLGFTIAQRWENEGKLMGVMVQAGPVQIGVSQDDWEKGRNRQKGIGVRFYLSTTQSIDEMAALAKKSGVALDKDVHDTDFGTRAFEVTEPSGFKFTITSHRDEW